MSHKLHKDTPPLDDRPRRLPRNARTMAQRGVQDGLAPEEALAVDRLRRHQNNEEKLLEVDPDEVMADAARVMSGPPGGPPPLPPSAARVLADDPRGQQFLQEVEQKQRERDQQLIQEQQRQEVLYNANPRAPPEGASEVDPLDHFRQEALRRRGFRAPGGLRVVEEPEERPPPPPQVVIEEVPQEIPAVRPYQRNLSERNEESSSEDEPEPVVERQQMEVQEPQERRLGRQREEVVANDGKEYQAKRRRAAEEEPVDDEVQARRERQQQRQRRDEREEKRQRELRQQIREQRMREEQEQLRQEEAKRREEEERKVQAAIEAARVHHEEEAKRRQQEEAKAEARRQQEEAKRQQEEAARRQEEEERKRREEELQRIQQAEENIPQRILNQRLVTPPDSPRTIGPEDHEDKQAEVPEPAAPAPEEPAVAPQEPLAPPPVAPPRQPLAADRARQREDDEERLADLEARQNQRRQQEQRRVEAEEKKRADDLRDFWGRQPPRRDPDEDNMEVGGEEEPENAEGPEEPGGDNRPLAAIVPPAAPFNPQQLENAAQQLLGHGAVSWPQLIRAQQLLRDAKAHIDLLEERRDRAEREARESNDRLIHTGAALRRLAEQGLPAEDDENKEQHPPPLRRTLLQLAAETEDVARRQVQFDAARAERRARKEDRHGELRALLQSSMLVRDMKRLLQRVLEGEEESKEAARQKARELLAALEGAEDADVSRIAKALRKELDGDDEDCEEVKRERDQLKRDQARLMSGIDGMFRWCGLAQGMLGRFMTGWRVQELPDVTQMVTVAQPSRIQWLSAARADIQRWCRENNIPQAAGIVGREHPIALLQEFAEGIQGRVSLHLSRHEQRVENWNHTLFEDGNQTNELLITEIYLTHIEFTRHLFQSIPEDAATTRNRYLNAALTSSAVDKTLRKFIVDHQTKVEKEFEKFKMLMEKSSDAVILGGYVSSAVAAHEVLSYLPAPQIVREQMALAALNAYRPVNKDARLDRDNEYLKDVDEIARLQNELYEELCLAAGVSVDL